MAIQLDTNDPKYALAAAAILDRHNGNEAEANMTSAIRDFLTDTALAQRDQIVAGRLTLPRWIRSSKSSAAWEPSADSAPIPNSSGNWTTTCNSRSKPARASGWAS